jgi:hypothetical protein
MKKKEYLQPQIQLLVGGLYTTLMVTSYAIGSEGGDPGDIIPIDEDETGDDEYTEID